MAYLLNIKRNGLNEHQTDRARQGCTVGAARLPTGNSRHMNHAVLDTAAAARRLIHTRIFCGRKEKLRLLQ